METLTRPEARRATAGEPWAWFRERRKARDLTQDTIAERLRVSQEAVSRWEKGSNRPDPRHWPALADALGVTPAEFARQFGLFFSLKI